MKKLGDKLFISHCKSLKPTPNKNLDEKVKL